MDPEASTTNRRKLPIRFLPDLGPDVLVADADRQPGGTPAAKLVGGRGPEGGVQGQVVVVLVEIGLDVAALLLAGPGGGAAARAPAQPAVLGLAQGLDLKGLAHLEDLLLLPVIRVLVLGGLGRFGQGQVKGLVQVVVFLVLLLVLDRRAGSRAAPPVPGPPVPPAAVGAEEGGGRGSRRRWSRARGATRMIRSSSDLGPALIGGQGPGRLPDDQVGPVPGHVVLQAQRGDEPLQPPLQPDFGQQLPGPDHGLGQLLLLLGEGGA